MTTSPRMRWIALAALAFAACTLFVPAMKATRQDCPGKWLTIEEARDLALQQHGRSCECSDQASILSQIAALEATVADLEGIESNGQPGDANEQHSENTGESDIIGKIDFRHGVCTPLLCDSRLNKCSSVWLATFAHEEAHCAFMDLVPLWRKIAGAMWWLGGRDDLAKLAILQAEGEINAYNQEIAYLKNQLKSLNCPKIAQYPGLNDSGADKTRLNGSAKRVDTYAGVV